MKRYAIIVAAGTGSRMQSELPKQFMLLKGKPVLYYSLAAFKRNDISTRLIVVLAKEEILRWKRLCYQHSIRIPHDIVEGGATRAESVHNGLAIISEEGLVAIHDGARPLVSESLIEDCFHSAYKYGSGIAAVKPKDSIRELAVAGNYAVDREKFRLMQTPQAFRTEIIKKSFLVTESKTSTDDATMAELAGYPVYLVEGSYRNIKITTPEDLLVAEALLE